ncbi:hypothetical protein QN362_13100 [Actimicrobium sp. CCC2.4]|uniref:hypothetical protein n=1 Tax=Actimicrobium sp. CCC2.4 TaxID=3048606 RepID=UPI002AC8E220|nr:hypothetical protein [Actimicrobium sp. CCC2.4]MEB0136272.1 hypothetical protein [Actimicrobium sp. CCC2.4]WPX33616.1 hypothetical protein RHM62_07255 [Actimicrobium sp. CCC2.4]
MNEFVPDELAVAVLFMYESVPDELAVTVLFMYESVPDELAVAVLFMYESVSDELTEGMIFADVFFSAGFIFEKNFNKAVGIFPRKAEKFFLPLWFAMPDLSGASFSLLAFGAALLLKKTGMLNLVRLNIVHLFS